MGGVEIALIMETKLGFVSLNRAGIDPRVLTVSLLLLRIWGYKLTSGFFSGRRHFFSSLSPLRFSQLVQPFKEEIPPATSQEIM